MSDQQDQPQSATAGTEQASSMELAYRAPTRHERLENFGKNWKAHSKITNAAHHMRHARAHDKLSEHHFRKSVAHANKAVRYARSAERVGKSHPKYQEWKAKAKEHNKLMNHHDKLEQLHRSWSDRHQIHKESIHGPHVPKKLRTHASVMEIAAKPGTFKRAREGSERREAIQHLHEGDKHREAARKIYHKTGGDKQALQPHWESNNPKNLYSNLENHFHKVGSEVGLEHVKLAKKHDLKHRQHASLIETAAHPHLQHFGRNAQFHASVRDHKHHLDHAHEHLAQAKHHHEMMKASQDPSSVLNHHYKRDQHAKWAERHIQHFHALGGDASHHASVEVETAAPAKHSLPHFGKDWKTHHADKGLEHHLRHFKEHKKLYEQAFNKGDMKKHDAHAGWAAKHARVVQRHLKKHGLTDEYMADNL